MPFAIGEGRIFVKNDDFFHINNVKNAFWAKIKKITVS